MDDVSVGLRLNAVHGLVQESRAIVDWRDHRHQRQCRGLTNHGDDLGSANIPRNKLSIRNANIAIALYQSRLLSMARHVPRAFDSAFSQTFVKQSQRFSRNGMRSIIKVD
jgi:hypothetical protein